MGKVRKKNQSKPKGGGLLGLDLSRKNKKYGNAEKTTHILNKYMGISASAASVQPFFETVPAVPVPVSVSVLVPLPLPRLEALGTLSASSNQGENAALPSGWPGIIEDPADGSSPLIAPVWNSKHFNCPTRQQVRAYLRERHGLELENMEAEMPSVLTIRANCIASARIALDVNVGAASRNHYGLQDFLHDLHFPMMATRTIGIKPRFLDDAGTKCRFHLHVTWTDGLLHYAGQFDDSGELDLVPIAGSLFTAARGRWPYVTGSIRRLTNIPAEGICLHYHNKVRIVAEVCPDSTGSIEKDELPDYIDVELRGSTVVRVPKHSDVELQFGF